MINIHVFGQHTFGVKISGGVSRISSSLTFINGTLKTLYTPSGQGGLFYNFKLGDKSNVGAELLFLQIEGREKIRPHDIVDFNGNIIGHGGSDFYKHISYIGLPVYYGFKINKIIVNVGFQASIAIASSARDKGQFTVNGNTIKWDNKTNDLRVDAYDYGPRVGIVFNLNDHFALEGTYYYGINNILNSNIIDWVWKVQQATIGLRYTFITTKKNESD